MLALNLYSLCTTCFLCFLCFYFLLEPNAPGIPTINTRTETKLVISSDRPTNSIIDGWAIDVIPDNANNAQSFDSADGRQRIFTIDNLSPGYTYKVVIYTKSGTAQSKAVMKSFVTSKISIMEML